MDYNKMNRIQRENDMDLGIEAIEDQLPIMGYINKNKKSNSPLFQPWIGTIMICFIVVFVLFFSSCDKEDNDKMGSILVRLDQIEEKQLKYAEIENKIDQLEILFKNLENDGTNLKAELETISKQVGILQKAFSSITEKPKASGTVQKKTTSQVKVNYYEVQLGDTLSDIANKYGLSVEELCSMNNISKGQFIHPGQKIIIK